ncbi:MAG: tetratricopeptide repeat protein [Chitinophagaceae bacterium]|nr:tetratricopeptide repeat protein [Chitinophagaceae bacterium]
MKVRRPGNSLIIINSAIICSLIFLCISCNTNPKTSKESRDEESLRSLEQQVTQYPDSAGLRLQWINALDSIGHSKEALQQLNGMIKKDSLNYGFWYRKGQIAQGIGDTLSALQAFAKANQIYSSPDALLSLANLYAETKNPRSILICELVKKMRLGRQIDASSNFIEGIYNARTGNRDQALKFFDSCIAQNYTYMEAYIEKGLVYFDQKKYREALTVFNFAGKVNNLYADAYYYQARCYEMMNQKDSAILRFQQSLSLDPDLKESKARLKRLGS